MATLILIIIVAFYFGWRMDRLERQLEDVHDSLGKLLTLPPDVRQAEREADLAAKKERVAKDQRHNKWIAVTVIVILLAAALLGILPGE
jgi:type VI protein secretion system component VasF